MAYEAQTFSAPDGTEMVVLPAAEYERLKTLADETEDVIVAERVLADVAREGTMPDEVLGLILDDLHPLAAWRRYRELSQAELARRAGLSQVWISRIEQGAGYGSRITRRKLAEALNAPAWALEEEEVATDGRAIPVRKAAKYRPLADHLRALGRETLTMRFDEIETLVGALPPSAAVHRPWWANHAGNSQARGWMSVGYSVEPDLRSKTATFTRR
jgi:transcriptional regulator with XRE-family HTH domain